MDAMMYKIEGEDLYLIGTSEHSMIGKFIDQIVPEEELPKTLTSYSPCFRKEKGAHGLEERGVYRNIQGAEQIYSVLPQFIKPHRALFWFADNDHFLLFELMDTIYTTFFDSVCTWQTLK